MNTSLSVSLSRRRRRRRSEMTSAGQSLYARILYCKIQLLILILISNNNNKVRAHGVDGVISNWIENWLKGRKQRVCIRGEGSTWLEVISGVPDQC